MDDSRSEMASSVGQLGAIPTLLRAEKYRDVSIVKVTNGFIVKVGCQTFVSKEWTEIATSLGEYWTNPAEAEKKFCK